MSNRCSISSEWIHVSLTSGLSIQRKKKETGCFPIQTTRWPCCLLFGVVTRLTNKTLDVTITRFVWVILCIILLCFYSIVKKHSSFDYYIVVDCTYLVYEYWGLKNPEEKYSVVMLCHRRKQMTEEETNVYRMKAFCCPNDMQHILSIQKMWFTVAFLCAVPLILKGVASRKMSLFLRIFQCFHIWWLFSHSNDWQIQQR